MQSHATQIANEQHNPQLSSEATSWYSIREMLKDTLGARVIILVTHTSVSRFSRLDIARDHHLRYRASRSCMHLFHVTFIPQPTELLFLTLAVSVALRFM